MPETCAHNETGVCSWSLREHGPGHLADPLIDELRVPTVQLALDALIDHHPAPADTIAALRDRGVRIPSAMMAPAAEDYSTIASIRTTGGFRPDSTWHANTERARVLAALAHETGIPLVTMHAGSFIDGAGGLQQVMLARIRTIARIFADAGVRVAFETGHERAHDTLRMLNELDTPNAGVNFDPANIVLYSSGDPVESLALLLPHVLQCHIKDALPAASRDEWGSETVVGAGSVDWPGFFATLATTDRTIPLMVEREAGESRAQDIAHALAFVRTQRGDAT
ncbi:MAG: sugar phosphate isomerase/epimerase family protein [Planctomycetota bacterium]